MQLAPGARLGPYEVLEPLGEGGMGQVWKARDTRLDRPVAIKIIAPDKSADAGLQSRFEREARALSALNHPNIVCVYDVGTQDGAPYIVSELVPGDSLRRIVSRGPLPFDRLVTIAGQIAGALARAHAAGIVHRDLKPENIIITPEGVPKILDFGLARRLAPASHPDSTVTQTTATQPGTVMGTAGYMSPEQICGEAVDGRSDIFSMGVVLYEMATGTRAFQGRSSIEMMSSVLKDDAPHLPAQLHEGLDRVIRRCLEKSPALRFQNAADLSAALQTLSAAPRPLLRWKPWLIAAAALPEIALLVWAFTHSGKKPAQPVEQKSAVVPAVSVPVAAPAPPPAPAAPPSVETARETPVRVPKKTLPVPPAAPPAAKAEPPANQAAYQQAYEQGMLALSQRRWQEAVNHLGEAARLQPQSAPAAIGYCHALAEHQDHEQAVAACSEAIRLAPNSADAYHDRGAARLLTRDFDHAVEDINAAIRLGDANLALAHSLRGRAHSGLKEWGDAIQDLDEAIRLNPQSPHFYIFRGIAFLARHQNQKAFDDFDQAIRLQPNLPVAYGQRALARQRLGDAAGAEADRTKAKGLRGK